MKRSTGSLLTDILRTAFIFLAAIVLLAGVTFFFLRSVVRGKEVEVPNVLGKSFVEAFDILAEHDLRIRREEYKYSVDLPEYHVVEQRPMPNQKVKTGRRVQVFLSRGTEAETVPRVIGKSVSEAESILKSVGLEVGSIVRVHSDSFPQEDVIVAHTPGPGATVQWGNKVNVLVSLGPHSVQLAVPDLRGMKLQGALEELRSGGLRTGHVTREASTEEDNIVLEQSPQPSDRVPKGTAVDIVVSLSGAWRMVRLSYQVPARPKDPETPEQEDLSPRHVRIVVEHDGGMQTVVDKMIAPGNRLERPLQIMGRGIARVFVDDMKWTMKCALGSKEFVGQ